MRSLRAHRHAFVRLALIAMLALACVPTLSRWLAADDGVLAWAQVCTPQGIKPVGDSDRDGHRAQSLDHCGYCVLASDPTAPAPAGVAMLMPVQSRLAPRRFLDAPRTLHAWATAQPRGPPSLS